MISNMKMEEYMGSKLSGIFRVKLVAKNVVLSYPPGNQRQADSAVWYLFLKKYTIARNQTVTPSVFLVKQYNRLIYVKQK